MVYESSMNLPERIKIGTLVYTLADCNVYQQTLYGLIVESIQKIEGLKRIETKDDSKALQVSICKAMGVLEYFQQRFQHYGELKEELPLSIYT